ncbi:hypothetical protein SteCoe_31223 [Stentor coeruleus]|uniref:DDE-1 domain-containing protein n=1 Tax=Stentor coeruleus TaxID=5963 RepID=A0A1R2B1R9_9CILI|nr:hypothetical protein SteCoe_31223 [Stentor coeruleus]
MSIHLPQKRPKLPSNPSDSQSSSSISHLNPNLNPELNLDFDLSSIIQPKTHTRSPQHHILLFEQQLLYDKLEYLKSTIQLWLTDPLNIAFSITPKIIRDKISEFQSEYIKKQKHLGNSNNEINNFLPSGWVLELYENLKINPNSLKEHLIINDLDIEKQKTLLKRYTYSYCHNDIFVFHSFSLYFRLLPEVFTMKSCKLDDIMNILILVNASGTYKSDISIVGTSFEPNDYEKTAIESLPLDYYNRIIPWVDAEIYTRMLKKLDKKMQKTGRSVLVLVKSSYASLKAVCEVVLKNITVVFFSMEAIKPCLISIEKSFKWHYRRIFLKLANKFDDVSDVSVVDVVYIVSDAWDSVTRGCISRAWNLADILDKKVPLLSHKDYSEFSDLNTEELIEVFSDTYNLTNESLSKYLDSESSIGQFINNSSEIADLVINRQYKEEWGLYNTQGFDKRLCYKPLIDKKIMSLEDGINVLEKSILFLKQRVALNFGNMRKVKQVISDAKSFLLESYEKKSLELKFF